MPEPTTVTLARLVLGGSLIDVLLRIVLVMVLTGLVFAAIVFRKGHVTLNGVTFSTSHAEERQHSWRRAEDHLVRRVDKAERSLELLDRDVKEGGRRITELAGTVATVDSKVDELQRSGAVVLTRLDAIDDRLDQQTSANTGTHTLLQQIKSLLERQA